MSQLSPTQIAKLQRTKPKLTPPEEYDPELDTVLAEMFGRVHDDLERFNPTAKRIYHLLNWSSLLGNQPDFDDVPELVSIAERTASDKVRQKAKACLRLHLLDCSGTDASLKPVVKALLEKI